MNRLDRATCDVRTLHNMLLLLVDFNTTVDILRRAERCRGLALHVAEAAVRANKVRAPGSV